MAAPKTNRNKEGHKKTIDKIRSTQLLNRLTAFALNEDDTCSPTPGTKIEMSAAQVTAAGLVIKKAIPDLSSVTMDANVDANVTITEIALTAPSNED